MCQKHYEPLWQWYQLEASLSFPISWSLFKLKSIELVMPSNHLIFCCPLLLLPSIFHSIRIFSNELALCTRRPKYWSFSFTSVLPMNIQGWFPLSFTGSVALLSNGLAWLFSRTTVWKHQFFNAQFSSGAQSCPTLQLHGLQHARSPCPSPTVRACSNSCPFSQWCHLTISSSVVPFSSILESFPASGTFQMNQLFDSGGRSTGVSASALVLPMTIQDWFPLGLTGSPCSSGDSQESSTPQFKSINSSALSFIYSSTLTSIHNYWKNHSLD